MVEQRSPKPLARVRFLVPPQMEQNNFKKKNNITRDLALIVFSIVAAIMLAKTGVLTGILANMQEWEFLGSFLAGMFFVSIFTAAPAAVVLFDIAASNSIWAVAFFGGVGALIGDILIFRFIKDSLAEDARWLIGKTKQEKVISIFQLKLFRRLSPFMGALVIASPLPDEIGLAMMSLSKMKTAVFAPLSFALNFVGILIVGLIAQV